MLALPRSFQKIYSLISTPCFPSSPRPTYLKMITYWRHNFTSTSPSKAYFVRTRTPYIYPTRAEHHTPPFRYSTWRTSWPSSLSSWPKNVTFGSAALPHKKHGRNSKLTSPVPSRSTEKVRQIYLWPQVFMLHLLQHRPRPRSTLKPLMQSPISQPPPLPIILQWLTTPPRMQRCWSSWPPSQKNSLPPWQKTRQSYSNCLIVEQATKLVEAGTASSTRIIVWAAFIVLIIRLGTVKFPSRNIRK